MGDKCIDYTTIPLSKDDELYATNNQFQKTGPKGFIEVKVLENEDLYVRVDLPGLPSKDLKLSLDDERKLVKFSGKALSDFDNEKDGGVREYYGEAGLGCDCCEIQEVTAKVESGVVRMTVSRKEVKDKQTKCTHTVPLFTGKSGRFVEDNPFVEKGRKGAFVGEPTDEGGLNFAVDVPGVCAEDVVVFLEEKKVGFYAETKAVSEHDDEGVRIYQGAIICPSAGLSDSDICWDLEFGVLKVVIPPPTKTPTTTPN